MKYVAITIALALSTIAGYFSVLGMMEIFPKYSGEIIALTVLLELAKITTAVYLHQNWSKVSGWTTGYLAVAACALAVITSLGVYSFLMKSHVDQTAKINNGAVKSVKLIEIERNTLEEKLKGFESRINLIEKSSEKKIDTAKKTKDAETLSFEDVKLKELNTEKQKVIEEIGALDAKKIDVDVEVDSEASIFGEMWFKILVVLLVLTLDPLALSLLMSAASLDNDVKPKKKVKPKVVKPKLAPARKKPVVKKKPKVVAKRKYRKKPKPVVKKKRKVKLPKNTIIYY